MHEMGIAGGIVEYSLSLVDERRASRVTEIWVEVGELMQVDVEALSEALRTLLSGPKLSGAKTNVKVRSAAFSCRRCGEGWKMDEVKKQLASVPSSLLVEEPDSDEVPLHFLPYLYPAFVHCPKCGSSDVAVADGQDVQLMRVVLE
ncbi:MAG: hydrogenase maturation nickel metallochaperone HypA [Nitrososphaerota archaeon]|jgi:hydrogenase nickel incorporation protein HypA/HybF|nr:hydrogenase maturation nickel metallochaperone HypA [Nitrososphaerota archaeon]MDG6967457.1 hydrogenase maturation nickel metallochaperone HypA [Nitrososphaerota archaeon]MDG6978379.1 hydrogenase maturation nickel metallochaperone HypA [Nitrososphaerota archaeon]MDG7022714.1 hydrogenase maturation nickel metallochaperone HypA [Nitrososphaerota archaeon]